jgi:acyl-CoA thioesterase-1
MIGSILVFGDSIGQGFYDEINGGWVRLLQRDFFNDTFAGTSDVNIINLSVSGHTSQEVRARIDSETRARINDESLLTIIAIGVNDSYEKNGVRRTSPDDFRTNVQAIITSAKTCGKVLVLGCSACVESRVQPTSWDSTLHYSNTLLKQYETILGECAADANVEFAPLWDSTNEAQQKNESMPDGIHPNPNGHKVIYNEVKRKLDEML